MKKSFVRLFSRLSNTIPRAAHCNSLSSIVNVVQVESNGTVLSTNWKEVGSKKVEGSPPNGMEVKKWEY